MKTKWSRLSVGRWHLTILFLPDLLIHEDHDDDDHEDDHEDDQDEDDIEEIRNIIMS